MNLAQSERAGLCDLLDAVGPDAPTLCGDWTSHDLAAHLWVRETDPLGAPGIVAKPLAGLTEKRMNETKERWPFAELVDKIRRGPSRFSVFALPGVDEPANATEFYIHHEDVRRAGEAPLGPRDLDAETEDWVWRRLKLLGRAFFRRAPVGVVLERPEGPGEPLRVAAGEQTVTLVGRPTELLLYAYGRGRVADVTTIGDDEAVEKLRGSDFSL
ncbi:TIGR03085 family metal-binding protein [Auraticoccus monumenti]|uniref:TIGR03085 family protein n=1 Tax=Auraticoccus monumenti TaxID=675864 RepID=A0A1G7B3F1_9ACTN|nr:TIGR03085 family metal-binding protein [Auraticoccus monumenti]SDE21553.1 TIGR03085 family protein [Auraticoccus monumenti]